MRSFARLATALTLSLPLAGCGGSPSATAPLSSSAALTSSERSPLANDAVAGVTDPTLRGVIADDWERMMRWGPTWATTIGDHRYDDQLAPGGPDAITAQTAEQQALLDRLKAIDPAKLGDTDRVTWGLLRGQLESDVALRVCHFEQWNIDSADHSLFSGLSSIIENATAKQPADAVHLIHRMKQLPARIDDAIANLKLGLAAGRVNSATKIKLAIEQLDTELAKPTEAWAMASPKWATAPAPDAWPAGERAKQVAVLRDVVATQIRPKLVELRAFLDTQVRPKARDKEGLTGLAGGDACYRATILEHVGLAKTPDELHQLGLAEIARTDREIAALGKKVLNTPDLAATIAKLREDRSLYFTSREELLAAAQDALDRSRAAIPRFFAVLPKTDCVLREIPAHQAPYTTIAYYNEPHYDGSKPGEYFVNTYKPETRAKFELEALTWHESIPGHHLQIAISQELGPNLPMFRKLGGSTAFVEGWALYTERLGLEMGLYTSDLSKIGQLSFDAWRASRLVVDTGIHAMGWTRAQAEQFMREHTALTPVNIANEVDRYIGWPGQALGYKVGQLEILKLRAEAEGRLGPKFDLKQFHKVVLEAGAVTLPVLDDRVRAWIAQAAR